MLFSKIFILTGCLAPVLAGSLSDVARDAIINYPCANNYLRFAMANPAPCHDSLLTGTSAQVSCFPGALVDMHLEPTFLYLDRPLVTGDNVIIIGTPPFPTVMEMALMFDDNDPVSDDDIMLYITARFNFSNTVNGVIRNSFLGGNWGAEETDLVNFPYTVGQEFKTTIVVEATEYKIFVDDVLKYTFAFRLSSPSVTKIRFWGDIFVKSVTVD